MTKLISASFAVIVLASISGCASGPRNAPAPLTGAAYERVCRHPSMQGAAFREAFACHGQQAKPATATVIVDAEAPAKLDPTASGETAMAR
jgi:hypothetical protein